jgi:hypothetical protein
VFFGRRERAGVFVMMRVYFRSTCEELELGCSTVMDFFFCRGGLEVATADAPMAGS